MPWLGDYSAMNNQLPVVSCSLPRPFGIRQLSVDPARVHVEMVAAR